MQVGKYRLARPCDRRRGEFEDEHLGKLVQPVVIEADEEWRHREVNGVPYHGPRDVPLQSGGHLHHMGYQHISVSRRRRARESLWQADPELLDVIDRRYDRVGPVNCPDLVYMNVAYKMGICYLLREYTLDSIFTLYGLREYEARAPRAGMVGGSFSQGALYRAVYVIEWHA